MKFNLLLLFLFVGQLLSAQIFTEVPDTPFEDVLSGSVAFSDIDGDGDEDVLITGNNDSIRISKLYTNDGMGNFSEVQDTPFEEVTGSSVAFSDVDMDGDEDVLITGVGYAGRTSKLFLNDGMGNFTEVLNTPFEGVWNSSIAFSDVDGDDDPDVLITGKIGSFDQVSKLYTNDGAGNFSEVENTPFEDIWSGSIAFSDIDGDDDPDLLITGNNDLVSVTTNLYVNDGMGNFTEVLDTPFDDVWLSSIAFSDVDGDGDEDVLITGANDFSIGRISKLYLNDGMGNFTEVQGTPFEDVSDGSIAFSDVDGDDDEDVLITGNNLGRISKLYLNDGMGAFSEVQDTPFENVASGSIAFSDVNGDERPDVLITGGLDGFVPIARLYTNSKTVSFIENKVDRANFEFVLYPNPARGDEVKVYYDSKENGWITLMVFDENGRLLKQQQEHCIIGYQALSIDIKSLQSGSYMIQLNDGKRSGVKKMMIH